MPAPLGNPDDIDLSKLRIAFYTDNGVTPLHQEIKRVVIETAQALNQHGLLVREERLPDMNRLVDLIIRLRQAANGSCIRSLLKRFGTTEPGPDLQVYFDNFNLASTNTIDLVLMESIDEAKSQALRFMSRYDAIICPPSHTLARPHEASWKDTFETWSYITIHNLLGWPGVSVRAGTSKPENLPVGVQVIAAPWREDIALAVAGKIESLMGGYQRPNI